MKRYLITYHAPSEILHRDTEPTPEQMEEGMKPWMDWQKHCGDHLIDLGTPLTSGLTLRNDHQPQDSSREVCGYSMLQAESIEQALELCKDHPHLVWNDRCELSIHEVMPMG